MTNIEEIIAKMREDCCQADRCGDDLCVYPVTYGEAKLIVAEIARLTAELDAAVSQIERSCGNCAHYKMYPKGLKRPCGHVCETPYEYEHLMPCDGWEWRGVVVDTPPPMLDAAYEYRGAEPPKEDA